MNRMLRWIFRVACCLGIARGAETMAYHFSSGPFESRELENSPAMKAPPAETPFIEAGDELRDVTGILTQRKVALTGSWAVWNQTRKLLVVHGGVLDQWRIEELTGFCYQDRLAKLTINWIRSETPKDPPKENDVVFASVTLLGGSMNGSSEVKDPSGTWTFTAEADTRLNPREDHMNTHLLVNWTGPDGNSIQSGYFFSPLFLNDDQTASLVSWFADEHGPAWRVDVKGEILLEDGTAWREARLLQKGDKALFHVDPTYGLETTELEEVNVAGERKLFTLRISNYVLNACLGSASNDEGASSVKPATPQPDLHPDWPAATIPEDLKTCLDGPMLDVRPRMLEVGVRLGPQDFAAYDPISGRIFIRCEQDSALDSVSQLFMVMDCAGPHMSLRCETWLVDETVPEVPLVGISMLSRSGMTSKLELFDAQGIYI